MQDNKAPEVWEDAFPFYQMTSELIIAWFSVL